jgi:lysophospholipase L1-like esterase
MKSIICILSFFIAMSCPKQQSQQKKIIFFGDSITELGIKPNGYITLLKEIFSQKGKNVELIGSGISGDKVYDLYLRLDQDVIAKEPDIVVIWIGVNDVWHKSLLGTGTDADKFERIYNAIVNKLKQNNITVFVCTPAVIGERTDFNELDQELDKYAAIIRQVGKESNSSIIDLRSAFKTYIKSNNSLNNDRGILTYDGVHLNDRGNQLVADEMYKALYNSLLTR